MISISCILWLTFSRLTVPDDCSLYSKSENIHWFWYRQESPLSLPTRDVHRGWKCAAAAPLWLQENVSAVLRRDIGFQENLYRTAATPRGYRKICCRSAATPQHIWKHLPLSRHHRGGSTDISQRSILLWLEKDTNDFCRSATQRDLQGKNYYRYRDAPRWLKELFTATMSLPLCDVENNQRCRTATAAAPPWTSLLPT